MEFHHQKKERRKMNTISELKPCPFCGKTLDTIPNGSIWDVVMFYEHPNNPECQLSGLLFSENWWNVRPVEDTLRNHIAELDININVLIELIEELETCIAKSEQENARLRDDKSNNVLLITKLRSVVAGKDQTISEMAIEIAQLQTENARLREELNACQSALKSMVYQYLYRPLDLKTREPCEDIYQHDFMSAGEEVCDYLVRYGLAVWTDDDKYAIKFIQKETE